jgi:hypothetical protein
MSKAVWDSDVKRTERQKKQTDAGSWKEWCWQGIGVTVPDDWEVLRFRKDYVNGFLLWADRKRYCFQLSWQRHSPAVSADGVRLDYIGRLNQQGNQSGIRPIESVNWTGIEIEREDRIERRYFHVNPSTGTLLEAVFVDIKELGRELPKTVLDSIAETDAVDWIAFGMRVRTDEPVSLEAADIRPGAAVLRFKPEGKGDPEMSFHRLGLLRHWMRTSLADWWSAEWTGLKTRVLVQRFFERKSATGVVESRAIVAPGAFGRVRPGRVEVNCVWIDPLDDRLYRHRINRQARSQRRERSPIGDLTGPSRFSSGPMIKELLDA